MTNRVGARVAAAVMRCIRGHSPCHVWCGIDGRQVPIGKWCRQGAPESPTLCNIVLDDALAEAFTEWQARGYGLYLHLPNNAMDAHGKHMRKIAGAAARVTHLAYADDMLLVGNSLSEVEDIYRMLHRDLMAKGLKVWEKQDLWSNHPSRPARCGGANFRRPRAWCLCVP